MLNRLYQTFWTERFVHLICLTVFLTLLLGAAWYFFSPGENTFKNGDFPAFYAAGKLSLENPTDLYNLNSQAKIQQTYFKQDGYHVFAYPPFVALFLEPLALFPPVASKIFYLLILLVCLTFTCSILANQNLPISKGNLLALLFFFPPLTISFAAGQNTAISLLLLSSAIYFANKNNWLSVGLLLGLLNFKPQYSAIAFGAMFFLSQEKVLLLKGFLVTSVLELLFTFAVYGKSIISSWLALLIRLGEMNNSSQANVGRMTSIPSICRSLSQCCPIAAILLALLCLFLLSRIIKKNRDNYTVVAMVVPFLSPQAGFYDLALILPFLFSKLGAEVSPFIWKYLLVCVLVYASMAIQFQLGVQILPIATLLICETTERFAPYSTNTSKFTAKSKIMA